MCLAAGLRAEIERMIAQLPEGMKHCTFLFKECEKGHGRLTATNWIDHGCQQCEIERLRALVLWALPRLSPEHAEHARRALEGDRRSL